MVSETLNKQISRDAGVVFIELNDDKSIQGFGATRDEELTSRNARGVKMPPNHEYTEMINDMIEKHLSQYIFDDTYILKLYCMKDGKALLRLLNTNWEPMMDVELQLDESQEILSVILNVLNNIIKDNSK